LQVQPNLVTGAQFSTSNSKVIHSTFPEASISLVYGMNILQRAADDSAEVAAFQKATVTKNVPVIVAILSMLQNFRTQQL